MLILHVYTPLCTSPHPCLSQEKIEPIDIYGPEGTRDLVRAVVQLTYSRVVAPHRIHELKNVPYLHGRSVRWAPTMPKVRTDLIQHMNSSQLKSILSLRKWS